MKINGKIIERIQDARVSIGLHKDNNKAAIQSYEMMSNKYLLCNTNAFILVHPTHNYYIY